MKGWEQNLEKLKRFKQIYNHINVPAKWETDKVLAQWVENIRISKNSLPAELYNQLVELKFDFEYRNENEWESCYEELVEFFKQYGHTFVSDKTPGFQRLLTWTQNQRKSKSHLSQKQVDQLNQLNFEWELSDKKGARWEFMYNELKKFKEKNGHVRVLRDDDTDEYNLGQWIQNIRVRSNRLTSDQRDRLDKLGFLWSSDIERLKEEQWQSRYEELKKFKKRFEHCNVPIKWKENKELSHWVSEQRLRDKAGKLLPERKKILTALGFSWSEDLVKQYEDQWTEKFEELKKHKETYGHLKISSKQNRELKYWVLSQTIMLKKNMLSADKVKRLDSLESPLRDIHEKHWEKMYAKLAKYVEVHGNVKILNRKEGNLALATWVVAQRQLRKKGELAQDRIEKLEKIGFAWTNELLGGVWMKNYNALIEFKNKFNHTLVPSNISEYEALSRWAYKQRVKLKKGVLTLERIELLEKIDFKSSSDLEVRWERRFSELIEFKKQFNHVKVSELTHRRLSKWILKQRQKHRRGKLEKEKVIKLREIGVNVEVRIPKKNRTPILSDVL